VWAYDVDEDSWSAGSEPDPSLDPGFSRFLLWANYDPITGLIVAPFSEGGYGTYDVDSDSWGRVTLEAGDGPGDLTGYHPETDQFIGWTTENTSLVNLRDGSVAVEYAEGPELIYRFPPPPILTAPDPDRGLGIVHTLGRGELHAYDPALPGWTVRYGEGGFPAGPYDGVRSYNSMIYDTVNDRLVVIGGIFKTPWGWPATDDVWALDTTSGSWTQLLEPSEPQT
jgi:hypothetical protein